MRADASWCGQCHVPATPVERAAVRSAAPDPGLKMEQVYSRWAGGPMSFGPVGRVVVTLLVLLFELWLLKFNPLGAILVGLVVVPLVLRDVWKRVPVQQRR